MIFVDGSVVHTSVISVGGQHLTNDISRGLRTPKAEAERLKLRYGSALVGLVDRDETMEVPSVGGRPPTDQPRQTLAHIIEPRVEEIFALVHREIVDTGYADLLASGLVITGGSTLVALATDFLFRDPLAVGYSMSMTCVIAGVLGTVVLWWGLKPFSVTAQSVARAAALRPLKEK